MRKLLPVLAVLGILGGVVYLWTIRHSVFIAAENDAARTDAALMSQVESGVAQYHDVDLQDDTYLYMLARIYIHSGKLQEADALLPQIRFLVNRRFMRELYAGLFLEYFSRGESRKAFAILDELPAIVGKINDTENTALQGQVKKYRKSHNVTEAEIQRDFCQLAGKLLAVERQDDTLQQLLDHGACAKERAHLVKYGMARYVMDGDGARAFALFEKYKPSTDEWLKDSYWWYRIKTCFKCPPPEKEKQKSAAQLLKIKDSVIADGDDAAREIFAEILLASDAQKVAQEVAESMENETGRTALLSKVSTAYLKEGREDAVRKIYENLGSFKKPPIEYGGQMEVRRISQDSLTPSFRQGGPQQWYDKIMPEVAALDVRNAAAFNIVMGFENDRTRFTALERFYGSGLEDVVLDTENCTGEAAACVLREMEEISDAETDEVVRDYMYYKTIEYALKSKLSEQAERMAKKVKKTDRTFCRNHVCFSSMADIIDHLTGAVRERCEKDIADSLDGLLHVIGQINIKEKRYRTKEEAGPTGDISGSHYDPETGKRTSYYIRREDFAAADKRRAEGMSAMRCHVVMREYRKYFAQPDSLRTQRNSYLISLAQVLRDIYNRHDGTILSDERLALSKDRLQALSLVTDEKLRRQQMLAAISSLNRRDSYFYRDENEQVLLDAMDGYESFRNDIVLWEAVLNGGTHIPQKKKTERAEHILKNRPWLADILLENRAYHGSTCQYMMPLLKTVKKIEKPRKEDREKVFTECILNLVTAEAYDTALRMAEKMTSGGEYLLRTQIEVLLHKLREGRLSFHLSEIGKKYHDGYMIGDSGFLHVENASRYVHDDPWRECPFFGLGVF